MTIGFGVFLSLSASFLSASLSASLGSGSSTTSTNRLLSGDHAYSDTPPLISVSFTASPPARFSSQICAPFDPWRDERKARYFPSGLQRGDDSDSGVDVTWICCCPSQLTIHTSVSFLSVSLMARATVYATHLPSGERCGSRTSLRL